MAAFLALLSPAYAQREPHIGYVYPAGGRQGTTFEAVIGGQYLDEVSEVLISGAGVRAKVIAQAQQVTPKEQQELKEKLGKIQEKRKAGQRLSPEDIKTADEIRKKLIAFGRRLANPSLGEFVTLQISVATNAPLERHELRLRTRTGLTNPRVFCVGQLPEVSKKDWKNVPKGRGNMEPELDPTPPEVRIDLPVVLNGQIPPGGVDKYRFKARAGQSLVVAVSARDLIPYLADAVPGWFQATVMLYDEKGKEVAYVDDYRFQPDPVLFYKIPKDGEYGLEIRDSLYRGREDFVYRIAVGELPFVTGVFPLGGKAGTQASLIFTGWNLPYSEMTTDLRNRQPGVLPLNVARFFNRVQFEVDSLPECSEVETNNTYSTAQAVTLPVTVNGRIGMPGDKDLFKFEGHAGQTVVAEVRARRLDSPVDSILRLYDPSGKQIAFNDDHEDKGSGLNTHHADSYLSVALPSNGTYVVSLADNQRGGGPAYAYRLRLSAPRPDFDLRVTPASLNVRGGASFPLTAFALRRDGFAGDIALTLKDAPAGFALDGAVIPAGQDQVKFTLRVPPGSPRGDAGSLRFEGRATIGGQTVTHPAVPADDMMQAFAYRHLVPIQEQRVAFVGRSSPRGEAEVLTKAPLKIPAGGTASVDLRLPIGPMISKIEFELLDPPDGLSIGESTRTSLVLQADAAKIKPGLKGNLIIKVFGEREPEPGQEQKPANMRRLPLGAMPAVPFEITKAP